MQEHDQYFAAQPEDETAQVPRTPANAVIVEGGSGQVASRRTANAARPTWLVLNRELLPSLAGSASFSVWLLAQTPQWMLDDLAKGQSIALAAYVGFIDAFLFSQICKPLALSIEAAERLIEEQVGSPSLTRSGTGYDAASIIPSSTRSPR
ncbi:hypothetical protein V8E36_009518 [Tilletia maclaganii]